LPGKSGFLVDPTLIPPVENLVAKHLSHRRNRTEEDERSDSHCLAQRPCRKTPSFPGYSCRHDGKSRRWLGSQGHTEGEGWRNLLATTVASIQSAVLLALAGKRFQRSQIG
jgi:hypothetical protein